MPDAGNQPSYSPTKGVYSATDTPQALSSHFTRFNDRGLPLHGRGLPLSLGLEQHAVGRQQRLDVLKVHALQRRGWR